MWVKSKTWKTCHVIHVSDKMGPRGENTESNSSTRHEHFSSRYDAAIIDSNLAPFRHVWGLTTSLQFGSLFAVCLGFARWYVIIPSFVYVIISNNHIAWYFYIEFYPILPECSCENRLHVAYGLNVNKHCAIRLQPKSCSNYRRAHQQQSQHGGCMSSVSQNHTSYVAGKTHLALDEMAAISQRTFSNSFSRTKSFDVMQRFVFWLKFHRSLFLRAQLTKLQHWFR